MLRDLCIKICLEGRGYAHRLLDETSWRDDARKRRPLGEHGPLGGTSWRDLLAWRRWEASPPNQ